MHQDGNPSTSLTNTQVGNFVSGLRLTITLCLAITLKIIWDLMNTSFVFNICCRWHHSCCFNIPMLPFDCTWLIIVLWMLERVLIMMHILFINSDEGYSVEECYLHDETHEKQVLDRTPAVL